VTRPESRSPLSIGVQWASRITGLGLEVAVPTLVGAYIDNRWHSSPAGVLAGMVLGFAAMMVHVLQIAREGTNPPADRPGGAPPRG
jgi:ATP synthase protein I